MRRFAIDPLRVGAVLLAVFGGIGTQGPHTNSGWLSLLVAMGCLPFGSLLFLLGAAKWLRNRRIREQGAGVRDQQ